MAISKNIINGAVKINGLLETQCITSVEDLIKKLAELLILEIPTAGISNVVVSNEQPGSDDRDSLWVRRANSGQVIGIFVFDGEVWVQLTPAPQQIFWLYGDSRTPPKGYQLVEAGSGIFTTTQITQLYQQAIKDPTNVFWVYYPAVFVGI